MLTISVTKRDGRKEVFIPEKIVVSAVKSGASPEFARTVAQQIGKNAKDGISTASIKDEVLSKLGSENPLWEKSWRLYDSAVKKRS